MKRIIWALLLGLCLGYAVETPTAEVVEQEVVIKKDNSVILHVIGQGVSPTNTISPAQAMALAKRAAIADAYRLMAEKVQGVKVDGKDVIRNMMVQRTEVRTCVSAIIQHANVVDSSFKDGMYEVELELRIAGNQWYDQLASY